MTSLEKILMKRDNISLEEARDMINECREQMLEDGNDEAIMDILGLEPDYIFDIL